MASQPAAQGESRAPLAILNNQLAKGADQFKMVLPQHITPEAFQRTILTAVQADPALLDADRQSLLLACMKCAQDGLLPDKREAAFVIFTTSKKEGTAWVRTATVQYMPMVYGLRKKILQSGVVKDITARVVYRCELESGAFVYEEGSEATLRHRPSMTLTEEQAADSEIIAAYSIATFADGTQSVEVMRRFEINKVRQASQTGAEGQEVKFGTDKGKPIAPKGPWVDWFPEQAKKTVMRRHSKTLPMSGDLLDVEARDDEISARSVQAVLAAPVAEPMPTRLAAVVHDNDGVILDVGVRETIEVEATVEKPKQTRKAKAEPAAKQAEAAGNAERQLTVDDMENIEARFTDRMKKAMDLPSLNNIFVEIPDGLDEENMARLKAVFTACDQAFRDAQ